MIEFQPDTDNRTTRVRVVVPDVVRDALEKTYADQTVGQLPYESETDAQELVHLFQVYVNRRGLKLHCERGTGSHGEKLLRFKMRDKRPYTKRSPKWEQASA